MRQKYSKFALRVVFEEIFVYHQIKNFTCQLAPLIYSGSPDIYEKVEEHCLTVLIKKRQHNFFTSILPKNNSQFSNRNKSLYNVTFKA